VTGPECWQVTRAWTRDGHATRTYISYIAWSLHVQRSRLSATIPSVVALAWLGFLGWPAALLLAIALVLGLLALIAHFGGGEDGLGF
jgi:hypothetical protein